MTYDGRNSVPTGNPYGEPVHLPPPAAGPAPRAIPRPGETKNDALDRATRARSRLGRLMARAERPWDFD